ncbi:MAG: hypothetical protein HC919_12060 [Oscillatoriales cyanobacterium SM2_2_1]|nr:hypothetical protein [Oscillatoriales cyanobacterium SM2_2_1]
MELPVFYGSGVALRTRQLNYHLITVCPASVTIPTVSAATKLLRPLQALILPAAP